MNNHLQIRTPMPLRALSVMALAALLLVANAPALAAPGAHGPNGEHLDGPTTMRAASALPRVEAKSETFELVAELRASELAIVVDRYESNEPVLGAKLEVERASLAGPTRRRWRNSVEEFCYGGPKCVAVLAGQQPGPDGLQLGLGRSARDPRDRAGDFPRSEGGPVNRAGANDRSLLGLILHPTGDSRVLQLGNALHQSARIALLDLE